MSKPEWDGTSQNYITWDEVKLPCVSVLGGEPDDGEWCASLPMENRCTLDLHVPDDGSPWVCISVALYDREEYSNLPILNAAIEGGKIVIRVPDAAGNFMDRLLAAVDSKFWHCEVDNPAEVQDYMLRWGKCPVVLG